MKESSKVGIQWIRKAAVCLAFFAFFVAKCHAQIGGPPTIAVQPLGLSVLNGGSATFTTTAVSLTSMQFKWQFNGKVISNPNVVNVVVPLVGTVSTLSITNVSAASQGVYSVKIENAVGEVVSQDANLIVLLQPVIDTVNVLMSGTGLTANGFQLNLLKPATSNCVVDASTDLKNWTPVWTNSTASTNISYMDTGATNRVLRYYRARLQ